jgi:hypothetical protein
MTLSPNYTDGEPLTFISLLVMQQADEFWDLLQQADIQLVALALEFPFAGEGLAGSLGLLEEGRDVFEGPEDHLAVLFPACEHLYTLSLGRDTERLPSDDTYLEHGQQTSSQDGESIVVWYHLREWPQCPVYRSAVSEKCPDLVAVTLGIVRVLGCLHVVENIIPGAVLEVDTLEYL